MRISLTHFIFQARKETHFGNQVSRENAETAGFSNKIKIIQGSAVDTIKALPTEPKFDLAFIDADKESNLIYFTEAKRLVRSGGVIVRFILTTLMRKISDWFTRL